MKYKVNITQSKTEEYEVEAENEQEAKEFASELWYDDRFLKETDLQVDVEEIPDKMTVLLLEPGKLAKVTEIGTDLKSLQNAVHGLIEAAYYFDDNVCMVCNDEGKINGMPLNRAVYSKDNQVMDIIAGPAFLCDCSGSSFKSLSRSQISKFQKKFKYPEHFCQIDGNFVGIKYNPEKNLER